MKRFFTVILILHGTLCIADIATESWPKKVREFPTDTETLTLRGFRITVRESSNQTNGGTGGRIYDFIVQNRQSEAKQTFDFQSIGVVVLESHNGWPQLEIWSRAGGINFCRHLLRFTGVQYEYVRTDDFTSSMPSAKETKHTTKRPGGTHDLYFIKTRIPEPAK